MIRFVRLSNRWFVDIPWEGDITDLEMVSGADVFLDTIANGRQYVDIYIVDDEIDADFTLHIREHDEIGATYHIMSCEYKGELWLCNVTKHVLGDFPPTIHISVG